MSELTSKFTVKFYQGEYSDRQRAANRDKAIVYCEHHFNSGNATADYACVVVGSNAGKTSRAFGEFYSKKVAESFNCKIGGANGLLVGGYNGRGNENVKYTAMPAALLEPLFCSNPKRASQIKSSAGQEELAAILVTAIKQFFPNGGLVAFSIGHLGKVSKPNDRGAAVYGGGTEAEYAGKVLKLAAAMLVA